MSFCSIKKHQNSLPGNGRGSVLWKPPPCARLSRAASWDCAGSVRPDFPPDSRSTAAPLAPWEGQSCVLVPTSSAARGAAGSDTMLKRKRSSDKFP